MEAIEEQKKAMRKQMLVKRAKLNKLKKAKYDQWICRELWEVICKGGYRNVHCYLPMGTEINIVPVIEKMLEEKITVVAPKTLPKRRLQNLVLKSLDKLEKGVFGTSHPADATEFTGQYDLIIVPGLAFNDDHFRLGYGGGYYDNFIVHHPLAYKLGIFYPFQKVDQVPLEPHDVQLDGVLAAEV